MRRIILAALIILVIASAFRGDVAEPFVFRKFPFFPEMPVSSENPVTVQGAELGRYLFYDPVLSRDSDMSCATCHQQQFAFSDNKAFSAGNKGKPTRRNSMPLFNLAWYPSYFWDGRAATIESQVFEPVRSHDEMNLDWNEAVRRIAAKKFYREKFRQAFGTENIDSLHIAYAIAQFERTLLSSTSRYDSALAGTIFLTKQEVKGLELMNDMTRADCLHCHTSDADALGTTRKFSNNGIDSVTDPDLYTDKGLGAISGNKKENGHFKIPSLRNLAFTAPYMHDGRFKTIEEVINFYSEGLHPAANIDSKMEFVKQGGPRLSCEEKEAIIAFLKTLNDSSFVKNPAFANPWK